MSFVKYEWEIIDSQRTARLNAAQRNAAQRSAAQRKIRLTLGRDVQVKPAYGVTIVE